VCCDDSASCACETLADDPSGKGPSALADGLRRIARVAARADARRAAWLAEAERTRAAEKQGFRSTSEWLVALTGEPVPVARSQVAVAEALQQMPETRKAFAAGEVSESRVRVLAQAQALAPGEFARDEGTLLAQVAAAPSQQVPQVLASWKQQTAPEAAEAEVERLRALRALHISRNWSGLVHLNGDLDPESGLVVLQAVRSLADPANLDPGDDRTPAQARADALVEICRRFLQTDGTGRQHPARVLVTVPWSTLHGGRGLVDTEAGSLTATAARRLACDATISRILLDPASLPIEVGRATRIIPPALRRALEQRDQHCTHPGCQIPARWCDAHHIHHWADGGPTALSNLRLLCSRHHTDAHDHHPYPLRR
jgi:hypothetical protein